MTGLRTVARLAFVLGLLVAGLAGARAQAAPESAAAAALQARFASLHSHLASNPFKRPLVLESTQGADRLEGEIFAVVDQPYARVAQALRSADHWCDILILHVNVKGCRIEPGTPQHLILSVGKKHDQPIADAYRINFAYHTVVAGSDYLKAQLQAADGPLGTRDYSIVLEAAPRGEQSLIHMSYAYGYGTAARIATQLYLATLGRDKVGFSVTGHAADGTPIYIGGVRGMVERNTMRYYLAIESYLDAAVLPAGERVERRLHEWHASTDRYARQLHELDQPEYLAMKRKEIERQTSERAPS